MSAATKSIGLKRICTGCGSRFYDLEKRPIICPSCEVEFTGEIKTKARRGSKIAEVKKEKPVQVEVVEEKEERELPEEELGVEVISLEDAEETSIDEDEKNIVTEDTLDDIPDVGVEVDDESDDDTLLVEVEED